MRQSSDQFISGQLVNGYDYRNQCWVIKSIVQDCGHPKGQDCGCYGRAHAGEKTTARDKIDLPPTRTIKATDLARAMGIEVINL